jgi:TetR/AcrR family transcriptional repressor of bet genes
MARSAAEPIRRDAIVKATIQEVGRAGSLEVTVAQIARRAGVSSALAHHYFGSKEAIFVAAMRHVLTVFGAEVRGALATARTPARAGRGRGAGELRRGVVPARVGGGLAELLRAGPDMPEARRLLHSITGGCGRTSPWAAARWWGAGGRGGGRGWAR